MTREREFVERRFFIVKARLEDPDSELARVERYQLRREYRLLGKILDEVPEGRVLETLHSWRKHFDRAWTAHRRRQQKSLHSQRGGNDWRQRRSSYGAVIRDKRGYKWVIDARYMQMVDDIIRRLQMWMAEDDELS